MSRNQPFSRSFQVLGGGGGGPGDRGRDFRESLGYRVAFEGNPVVGPYSTKRAPSKGALL